MMIPMRRLAFFLGLIALCLMNGTAFGERLLITGSTTVKPIAEKIAASYRAVHPNLKIEISGGGSGNGIKAIIDGTTDIGAASRFIKEKELQYAHGKGTYPVPFRVAYDCIVPIVHPENRVKDLTLDQIRKIYLGVVDNWKLVGGKDMSIKVISRDTSSGTYEVWEERVMDGQAVLPGVHLEGANENVVESVASDINAIGYIGLGYLNDKVRSLKINHIMGSAKTTIDGTYPLSRPLFMFTRGWPTGDTLKFINFVLDPNHGQRDVAASGFVAVYDGEDVSLAAQVTPDPNYIDEIPQHIEMVQEYLKALGYDVGPLDGIKGGKTITAIVAFQRDYQLPLEWRISKKMVSMLSDQYMQTTPDQIKDGHRK